MTLRACSDCGQEVSTEARACPRCGRPVTADYRAIRWVVGLLGVAMLFPAACSGGMALLAKNEDAALGGAVFAVAFVCIAAGLFVAASRIGRA